MMNCTASSDFTSLQCCSTSFQSLMISGGSGNFLPVTQPLHSSIQGGAANDKPLFEFQRQSGSLKDGVSSTHLSMSTEKLEKETKGEESGNKESRPLRLVIRLRPKCKKNSEEYKDEEQKIQSNQTDALGAEELEKETEGLSELGKKEGNQETSSSRKILIRLPSKKKKISEGIRSQEEQKIENYDFQEDGKPLSALNDHEKPLPKIEEKQMKRGFTMALSREEIEEDIIALIGSKPSRRPKKRSRTAKKRFNNLFPGAWLESLAADDD